MGNETVPQDKYKIAVKNSRSTIMALDLEPLGFSWDMQPGESIELIFENPNDFWSCDPLMFTERGVTFSLYGTLPSVLLVNGEEREELL